MELLPNICSLGVMLHSVSRSNCGLFLLTFALQKILWLNNGNLCQAKSGAPGVDILNREENEFVSRMDFLCGHINRRKRHKVVSNVMFVFQNFGDFLFHTHSIYEFFYLLFVTRTTTRNFGPGHSHSEVSQDSVSAAPEHEADDEESEDELIPLAQLCSKKRERMIKQIRVWNFFVWDVRVLVRSANC